MQEDLYQQRFDGIARLYGHDALSLFRRSRVAIIGIGGVGSWAAEALIRTGILHCHLIDLDDICISNSNRQLHTTTRTVGKSKVAVMAERLLDISPDAILSPVEDFFTSQTCERLLEPGFDLIIDAIDSRANKCLLLHTARLKNIPIVTIGGAGGRRDPSLIRISDLAESSHDSLLRSVRRDLKKKHQFPEQGPYGIPAIFSLEAPVFPQPDGTVACQIDRNSKLPNNCQGAYGSASFVTGAFGFAAVSAGLQLLIKHQTQRLK